MTGSKKVTLRPTGLVVVGGILTRLEWALATVTDPVQLATFFEPLRVLTLTNLLEDIGREATVWHDSLSNRVGQTLGSNERDQLREIKTRWEVLTKERSGDLYLITPATVLEAQSLMEGVVGLLDEATVAFLAPIEVSDLNDACKCLLIGSWTPAEYSALRATESLLRRWYESKSGTQLRRAWGRVLDKLVTEYPEDSRPKELATPKTAGRRSFLGISS